MGRNNKPPPRTPSTLFSNFKFAMIVIVAIGLLSFGVQVYRGLKVEVPILSTTKELKEAFFGGKPWVIQCVGGNVPVHDLTKDLAQALTHDSSVRVGAVACSQKMPSGNTFWKRFGIKQRSLSVDAPLLFLVANGDTPTLIDAAYLQSPSALANLVLEQSKPTIHHVTSESDLKKHCVKRKMCVMFVGGESEVTWEQPHWLPKLVKKYRATRMVWVDGNTHRLSFESELSLSKLATQPHGSPHIVVFRPLKGSKSGKVKGAGLILHSEDFGHAQVAAFLDLVVHKGNTDKQVKVQPVPQLLVRGNKRSSSSSSSKSTTQTPTPKTGRTKPPPPTKPPTHARVDPQTTAKHSERQHIRLQDVQQEQLRRQQMREHVKEVEDVEEEHTTATTTSATATPTTSSSSSSGDGDEAGEADTTETLEDDDVNSGGGGGGGSEMHDDEIIVDDGPDGDKTEDL